MGKLKIPSFFQARDRRQQVVHEKTVAQMTGGRARRVDGCFHRVQASINRRGGARRVVIGQGRSRNRDHFWWRVQTVERRRRRIGKARVMCGDIGRFHRRRHAPENRSRARESARQNFGVIGPAAHDFQVWMRRQFFGRARDGAHSGAAFEQQRQQLRSDVAGGCGENKHKFSVELRPVSFQRANDSAGINKAAASPLARKCFAVQAQELRETSDAHRGSDARALASFSVRWRQLSAR